MEKGSKSLKGMSPVVRRRVSIVEYLFIGLSLVVAVICLVYFIMLQTGKVHVTRELEDGSIFSGYWQMGEPFGQGVLITADGELIEGVWEDGKLKSGEVISREFTYNGGLEDYLPQGFGSCHYKNGVRYYGHWDKGVKSGLGRLVTPQGDIAFGIWKDGELEPVPGQRFKVGERVYGMDVSKHQGKIKWEEMALYADSLGVVTGDLKSSPFLQPVWFAVVKSTEGMDYVDPNFTTNIEGARRSGIVAGAYHFLRLSDINGQIENFIKHTPLLPGDLPPVLDMELSNREMARYHDRAVEYAHTWLNAIEKHYGVRPILYTYDSYYNSYLKGRGFEDYVFFIARYHPETMPRVPHLEIWQYTEKGRAGGIEKYVDLDRFFGNYKEFDEYVTKEGIKHPVP